MYGVVEGLMRCQQARTEDLNKRVRNRTFPSQMLQSTFSPRPVPTRYVKMPAIDCKKKTNVFIKKHPTYSSYNVFNPGNAQAPWSGWELDTESFCLKFVLSEIHALYSLT